MNPAGPSIRPADGAKPDTVEALADPTPSPPPADHVASPPRSTLLAFLNKETAAGLSLIAAAALALLVANGPLADGYVQLLDLHVAVTLNGRGIDKPLLLWINDGLMASGGIDAAMLAGAVFLAFNFYSGGIDAAMLAGAAATVALLTTLNRIGVAKALPYVLLGVVLWVFVLKSGVHATLAGVAAALAIPLATRGEWPLERMEHALHPYIAFGVLPVFAFANAGVSFDGLTMSALIQPLPLGIASGLVVGKLIGVAGFAWAAERLGLASLPEGIGWGQIVGLAALAGVGFTMSLFIGGLAFADADQLAAVKVGVLMGSGIASVIGLSVLTVVLRSGRPGVA